MTIVISKKGIDSMAEKADKLAELLCFLSEIFNKKEIAGISHWFDASGNEEVTKSLLEHYRNGSKSIPRRFVSWLLANLKIREFDDIPGWQKELKIDNALTVIQLMSISEKYSGSASGQNLRKLANGEVVPSNKGERLGIGYTIDAATNTLKTLIAVEDEGPLYEAAIQMQNESVGVEVCKVGYAQVGVLESRAKLPQTINLDLWHPGRPVAHQDGTAGSLTAFVRCREASGDSFIGFIGSSHVLTNMGRGNKGDGIFSPAPPFSNRDLRYRIGTLAGGGKACTLPTAE